MKLKHFGFILACISPMSFAGAQLDWGYTDAHAPKHWANLNSQYQACSGSNQSPINIQNTVKAKLPALKFNYKVAAKSIVHNTHTVKVYFNAGNTLKVDHQDFELKQFHLHSPSENTIHGQSYPMEMHLVHASQQGELTVVAVMFKEGKENKILKDLLQELPQPTSAAMPLKQQLIAAQFLPKKLDYYRFNGSLTTPPCTEGVRWIVLKEIQQASKQQIQTFNQLLGHANNRPVQAQNARLVLE